jgi:regulator of protease activity HflC (stomatin/prohibitin superfamily)
MSYSRHSDNTGELSAGTIAGLVAGVVLVLFGILALFASNHKVSAGEICVITKSGKVTELAEPGRHWNTPFITDYNCYNARLQTIELVENPEDTDSKANFVDWAISTHSVDGQPFTATAIIQYHLLGTREGEPTDQITTMFRNGARNDERIYEIIVKSYIRGMIPGELNKYTANRLYTGELDSISQTIWQEAFDYLYSRGVVIDNFQIKRPNFSDEYEQAIAQVSAEAARASAVQAQQETARQEAERKRIEAEGQAAADLIAAEGQAAVSIAQQDAINQNTISSANAQAEANATIGATYQQYPELLEHERIGAITSANVIYLPSDVLGIVDVSPADDTTP